MAFMFTNLGGVIRIGKYTPEGSIPLGRGKEHALIEARSYLGEEQFVIGATRYVVPGVAELPDASSNEGYFERIRLITEFGKKALMLNDRLKVRIASTCFSVPVDACTKLGRV